MGRQGLGGVFIILSFAAVLAAGCGGGGGSPAPSGSISALGWEPPGSYSDNAVLDPYQDLEYYEVYVREDQNFSNDDDPVALISAVTDDPALGGGRRLETEFILDNLSPFIAPGKLYYVSLKSVGVDGQKSAFMTPVSWEHRAVLPL